ncbi:MAG TPA: hypothetical protein VKX16_14100 [Chloroflexota bacterium]|nr:hypothetical protein [Chloroflexota bacterium]
MPEDWRRRRNEVQNQAAEVALRAKRKAGELLAETIQHQGGRPSKNLPIVGTFSGQTLAELGIDRHDSDRWQAIASVPAERFEQQGMQAS